VLVRLWSIFVGIAGGFAVLAMVVGVDAMFFDDDDGARARLTLTAPSTIDATAATTSATAPTSATTSPATSPTTVSAPATAAPAPETTPPIVDEPAPEETEPVTPLTPGTVTLLDVYTEDGLTFVSVDIDGIPYDADIGGTFGSSYRVDGIDGACAQFRHGDTPFRLCKGESIQV
jgi:hypothetical protein